MLDPQITELLRQFGYDATSLESLLTWGTCLMAVTVIAAIPSGIIAKTKGRSVAGWVMFALSLPIIPLVIVWLLPAKSPGNGQ